jgi:hypothetical protein
MESILAGHDCHARTTAHAWVDDEACQAVPRRYALCLVGFGLSTKAIADYSNGNLWAAQISAFVEQVGAELHV